MSRPDRGIGVLAAAILSLISSLAIVAQGAAAQSVSNSGAPLRPAPPATDQEQFLPYWTTETGWSSELQLRNIGSGDLTVTPSLRLPDGTETALGAVTVKSQDVRGVDLGQAISAANASQLIGTYGSVVLRYLSPSLKSLYAAMMVRRPGYPIEFHVDATGAMGESQALQAGSREGIWWLPQSTVSDYLILNNEGADAIRLVLSIYDATGRPSRQNVSLGPHQTLRYAVRALAQAAGLAGSYGGIEVSTKRTCGIAEHGALHIRRKGRIRSDSENVPL